MRVALVEPYYGGSHRAWSDGFATSSRHDVSLITHGSRFWKWRMHGGFLTLAELLEADIAENGAPDVILASTMMNVAAFAGAVRHVAPGVPIAAYFHESQFTYPLSPADRVDLSYKMMNWASAAVADLVIFNSEYHRNVFRHEARRFLNDFPENKHIHRVDDVVDSSIVLPVGIDVQSLVRGSRPASDSNVILWNQRWEHDKGPALLHEIITALVRSDVDFTMAMCGEVFVSVPPEFAQITELVGDRLVHSGWAERDRYVELLLSSAVVLSTADQEFFGVAVVEGIASGATPVLPDRLVYPERAEALGADVSSVLYSSPGEAAELIRSALESGPSDDLREACLRYDWSTVAPEYDAALASLV